MNWLDMNNAIVATLSVILGTVVGTWVLRRLSLSGSDEIVTERRTSHRRVDVIIDAEFLKTFLTVLGVVIFVAFALYLSNQDYAQIGGDTQDINATLDALFPTTANVAAPLPAITGSPVHIEFPVGSYGTSVLVEQSTRFELWAVAGQTMKLSASSNPGKSQVDVFGPNGTQLQPIGSGVYRLLSNGKHTIDIYTEQHFTLAFEIR